MRLTEGKKKIKEDFYEGSFFLSKKREKLMSWNFFENI